MKSIVSLLPQTNLFIDATGGPKSVAFQMKPTPMEVFNDTDSGVINLFRTLRNTELLEDFLKGKSRDWFNEAFDSFDETTMQGMRLVVDTLPAYKYLGEKIKGLESFYARLIRMQLEHDSIAKTIKRFSVKDSVLYLDADMVPLEQKEKVVEELQNSKSKIVMKGMSITPATDGKWKYDPDAVVWTNFEVR